MSSFKRTSERPTLPSIHTLDLPFVPKASSSYDTSGKSDRDIWAPRSRYAHGLRKSSTSSSTTSMSRSPSPSYPSSRASSPASSSASSDSFFPSPPTSATMPAGQVRLVPCSFEEANAIIVMPTTSTNSAPSSTGKTSQQQQQPLLLVGSAMQQYVKLRHPQREMSKNARVHPYKIMPSNGGSLSRRSSVASLVSNASCSSVPAQ
ncbi:hypothetical protein CC1G_02445 [Coprinopsis cinerea okayama7|uniref:Uncharacterized protein n=1 Tax=Coprinopsis cinerea (strain Okayama-7 / 130 / ATCC MYA-4618 / FGSC 9003) TaxID=240176 RepID=A8NBI5_COPC7|nr:hypothetical protein CC1G_02445 [Coprinopsis cinerea okayama7\|eukprot:XP_001832183.1 hypothetical protein CC1G_02445 [Coprinopsis cinerea okayama7\